MKRIGVIGGIGPQATMDFEARVHAVSQRLIPGQFNRGYPPMVVCYLRDAPLLVHEDGSAVLPPRASAALIDAASAVGPFCDFVVITSNGAHVFEREVEEASGRPVLSMVDCTLDEVTRRGWQRAGVLGLGYPAVYTVRFERQGLAFETVDDARIAALDAAIFTVMEGRITAESRQAAEDAVNVLRARDVDGVILGCTEIPFLVEPADDLISPIELLAEAAVRFAMED